MPFPTSSSSTSANAAAAAIAESSAWDHGSPSLVPRRRSASGDTATMIRRTLAGGEDDNEREILDLARRLARPLVGEEVRRAYGGAGSGKGKRSIKRTETS